MDGQMARRKRECGGKAGGGWVDRMNGWRPLDGRADGPTEA